MTLPDGRVGAQTASASYAHVWNEITGAQLNYLHLVEQPVVNGVLNDATFLRSWLALTPLLDLRADVGTYNVTGNKPAAARNFQQAGGRFGAALAVLPLHSDIVVSQTWLAQATRTRKDISLFEASWTLSVVGSTVGLKASYSNGNLEDTAQHIQQWLISLSARY